VIQGVGVSTPTGQTSNDQLARLARRYVRHAFLISGDRETALDVVADVTLRVLEQSRRHDIEDLNAYFRRCVVNRAIDLGKRRARDLRAPTVASGEATHARDIADAAIAAVMVGDALGRISPKLRAVIVLRFYDDLSDIDIAAALEIPIGTVKSRLARGLDQLESRINGRSSASTRRDVR
jgi:RNA polymerase sigma factor (sigma-70 family)